MGTGQTPPIDNAVVPGGGFNQGHGIAGNEMIGKVRAARDPTAFSRHAAPGDGDIEFVADGKWHTVHNLSYQVTSLPRPLHRDHVDAQTARDEQYLQEWEQATVREKTLMLLTWKFLFFAGGCAVLLGGLIGFAKPIISVEWAPWTIINSIFLTAFGLLMIMLDVPLRQPSLQLASFRETAYKYGLFMTRLTGRGAWYLFLSTLVFHALAVRIRVDLDVCFYFTTASASWQSPGLLQLITGWFISIYLALLGLCALVKGFQISSALDTVRQEINRKGHGAEYYFGRTKMLDKAQFKTVVDSILTRPQSAFTSEELDYIINALSFTPYNDGQVSVQECEYWLRAGPKLYV